MQKLQLRLTPLRFGGLEVGLLLNFGKVPEFSRVALSGSAEISGSA
jgi:hypothetical protein